MQMVTRVQRGIELLQRGQRLHAVHTRHLEIGDDDVVPVFLGHQHRFLTTFCRIDVEVIRGEFEDQHVAHAGLVIHDQDSAPAHGRRSRTGSRK